MRSSASPDQKPRKLLKLEVSDELHAHVWSFKREKRLELNQAIVLMLEEHRLMDNVRERLANASEALVRARRRLGEK
jgi:hypothetical protein